MAKDKHERQGVVYSTNPAFQYEENTSEETNICAPNQQCLYVSLDRKQRAGKVVTLVEGYVGSTSSLEELAKTLKQKCGVGGSAKDGEIIIQGDFREKVIEILTKQGFKTKRKGG